HTEQIGVDDGFFDVGGDSLLLVAVAERIKRELAPIFTATDPLKYSTVRQISHHIAATTAAEDCCDPMHDPEADHGSITACLPYRSSELPGYLRDSLAIIGISCQFPDAPDHRTFWQNLRQGRA